MSSIRHKLLFIALLLLIALPVSGQSTGVDLGSLDRIQENLQTATNAWRDTLEVFANRLLISLATIALAWQGILMLIRNSDLSELLTEVVKIIMYTGFFAAVIEFSAVWCEAIVEGFAQAAIKASHVSTAVNISDIKVGPADTLRIGIGYMNAIWEQDWDLKDVLPAGLACLIIVLTYAAIAGYQLLVLAEMYIVTAAGVIFLGFGGSNWSRETAVRHIWYVISIGAKLYALYLIIGFGGSFVNLANVDSWSLQGLYTFAAMIFMLAIMVVTIPNIIQGMVNGSSFGSSAAAGNMMLNAVTRAATMMWAASSSLKQGAGSLATLLKGGGAAAAASGLGAAAGQAAGQNIRDDEAKAAESFDSRVNEPPPPPPQTGYPDQAPADQGAPDGTPKP